MRSPDGSALAAVVFDGKLKLGVLTASPVGSPLRRYERTPFATADFANSPLAQFSPDNRSILLVIDVLLLLAVLGLREIDRPSDGDSV